jgi:AraC-like DNA-binding protein
MQQTELLRGGRRAAAPETASRAGDAGHAAAARDDTLASRLRAVERVITAARERLCEPLSLREMSRIAYISPFHFNRVFHQITGLPPTKFVGAMRLGAAKRLLLTTSLSITDVCYEVGYSSLGTFTTRFTELVGLGPREFRRLAERVTPASMSSLCGRYAELSRAPARSPSVTGLVESGVRAEGPIFVGLFTANVPQSRPVGGALLTEPGPFHVAAVPDGTYHLLAASLPASGDALEYLLPEGAGLLVGAGDSPVCVRRGRAEGVARVSSSRSHTCSPARPAAPIKSKPGEEKTAAGC